MKQRDLLFAGLLLLAAPAWAQNYEPGNPADPTRDDSKDPAIIFEQGFEDDWDSWSTDQIDVIDTLWYYVNHESGQTANMWETDEFDSLIFRTDSVIPIYRGNVLKTDAASEEANYQNDTYDIITEESQNRANIFGAYGEDGGSKVFTYYADSNGIKAWWQSAPEDHSPNYRRNLFVRLPKGTITDETPYRLSFFVKATDAAKPGRTSTPRVYADLMRGYFHSEKPFSMGLQDDADHYKYKTTFEWDKNEFTGDWEKVTYMTYYLNDSIADAYVFVASYYWDSTDWTWAADREGNTTGKTLNFIKQPDKYFARISFSGDNTKYEFDNLSLMRSWIAGANFAGDKLRIDFGFKNNIKDLCAQAKKETGIDQVEVPFDVDSYNFEVWGLKADGNWGEIYIRSAEYHPDGYLYMFTEYYDSDGDGEDDTPYNFNSYKKVLVSFMNPTDPKKQLKYTGDGKSLAEAFPKALDTLWIKAGKVIPDLVNEIATPVPEATFAGVYSMKDLPPLLVSAPYEDNSFGLPAVDELRFEFSRRVACDAAFAGENTDNVVGKVNGVAWKPSTDGNFLVLRRPDNAPRLSGDVEVQIFQLYGTASGTNRITNPGEAVVKNYHFGKTSRSFNVDPIYQTDWDADVNNGTEPIPLGTAIMDNNSQKFTLGDGQTKGAGSRLYPYANEGQFNRGFYVCPRSSSFDGRMFVGVGDDPTYFIRLKAGQYQVSFFALGWDGNDATTDVYVYKRPVDVTPDKLAADQKTKIGTFTPTNYIPNSDGKKSSYVISTADQFSFKFTADADTAYVFEFFIGRKAAWHGNLISDLTITKPLPISYGPVSQLNASVDAAIARIAAADANKDLYTGSIYNFTVAKKNYYAIGGEFDALDLHKPTEWAAAKKDLDDATNLLKLRMDTVDAFVAQRTAVTDKLTSAAGEYSGLATYKALEAVEATALAYPVTTKLGSEIYEFNTEMKNAVQALDDRIAINKKLADEITRAANLIQAAEKPDYEEYPALQEALAVAQRFDAITPSDDEISAAYAELNSAANAYDFRVQGYEVKTKRLFALRDLATSLGSNIAENENVAAALATIENDDDKLADILKAAIKIAIYQKVSANDAIYDEDSLDITPFIKNYYLYQTPKVVERTDIKANNSQAAQPDPDGANMEHLRHTWNSGDLNGSMPIWIMIQNQEYSDLYPGWTVKAFLEGNQMVTGDKSYNAYVKGLPIFDAEIGMDWNGKAEMKQDLADLPAGYYTLGVEITEAKFAGSDKIATLTAVLPDSTYVNKATESKVQTLAIDSIHVNENDTIAIDFVLRSENGWSRADNFFLSFRPDKDVEYDEKIAAEQAKISTLLTIVDAAKAQGADAEFYTLGGMKVAAPKAGEVLIRKTITTNGKVVVDKVLLK